ncbi:MAG: hypothetical protein EPN70_14335 [Paraburkholderia sp.]|uniref:hypothetical protein n=1 Tax=Paraburkholderia sp. TaxID=1926495 RepID=UPI001203588B|nr:hypothetical protein [Paraburkholderia sp.]TAM03370.1 MAG: hypothetical protein EPN70_14335 [Paraburkholderia sp.]TAM30024.1 MAG: hypothetical protein EPN59_10455 [Paraburkholderia sp.]
MDANGKVRRPAFSITSPLRGERSKKIVTGNNLRKAFRHMTAIEIVPEAQWISRFTRATAMQFLITRFVNHHNGVHPMGARTPLHLNLNRIDIGTSRKSISEV